jgi:hypothetical protein
LVAMLLPEAAAAAEPAEVPAEAALEAAGAALDAPQPAREPITKTRDRSSATMVFSFFILNPLFHLIVFF